VVSVVREGAGEARQGRACAGVPPAARTPRRAARACSGCAPGLRCRAVRLSARSALIHRRPLCILSCAATYQTHPSNASRSIHPQHGVADAACFCCPRVLRQRARAQRASPLSQRSRRRADARGGTTGRDQQSRERGQAREQPPSTHQQHPGGGPSAPFPHAGAPPARCSQDRMWLRHAAARPTGYG
jgi:hypothetical protein